MIQGFMLLRVVLKAAPLLDSLRLLLAQLNTAPNSA